MEKSVLENNLLMVSPELAKKLKSVNQAIFLQQIHYWLKKNEERNLEDHFIDGRWWTFNTYEDWQKQFPFWCVRTIKTIVSKLKDTGILLCDNYNKMGCDHTIWYSIDYERLETVMNSDSANVALSKVQTLHDGKCNSCTTNTIDYADTSPKDYQFNGSIRGVFPDRKKTDFDFNVVRRQIYKSCKEYDVENTEFIVKMFEYYYGKHKEFTGKNHDKYNQANIDKAVLKAVRKMSDSGYDYDWDVMKKIIDEYFQEKNKFKGNCNYNILHFLSGDIIRNRIYDAGLY